MSHGSYSDFCHERHESKLEEEHLKDQEDYSEFPLCTPKRVVTFRQNPLDEFNRPGEFRYFFFHDIPLDVVPIVHFLFFRQDAVTLPPRPAGPPL